MGNQTPNTSTALSNPGIFNPDLREWKMIGEGNNYFIWRHTNTNQQLEQYIFTATDSRQFEQMKKVFEFRHEKDYVVASKYFKQQNRSEICSTFYQGHLFVERIPLRLKQIKDLPYPDSLHLLHSCLRGFKQLYLRVGSFSVHDHLVGINSDAKIKVWLNEDFGRARHEGQALEKKQDQRLMVSEIIELVDKTIDHKTQPQSVTQYICRNFSPNFEEALARLEQYAIKHRISIPPILTSIALLRDKGYFKKMLPRSGSLAEAARMTQGRIPQPILRNNNQISSQLAPEILNSFSNRPFDQQLPPINYEAPIPIPPPIEGSIPGPVLNPDFTSNVNIQPIVSRPPIRSDISQTFIHPKPLLIHQPTNQNIINQTSQVKILQTPLPPISSTFPNNIVQPPNIRHVPLQSVVPPLVSIPKHIQLTVNRVVTHNPELSERNIDKPKGQQILHRLPHHQRPLISQSQPYQITSIPQSRYPSDTSSALDSILQKTYELQKTIKTIPQIKQSLQIQKAYHYDQPHNTSTFTINQTRTKFNQDEGYTDPQLLRTHTKLSSTPYTNYSTSSPFDFNLSERRVQDGYTDPSLLSKAVSGVLNLITPSSNMKQQFRTPNIEGSGKPYISSFQENYQNDGEGTKPSLLSKMTDFKVRNSNVNRQSLESNFSFRGNQKNDDQSLLTSLLIGGIIAAPQHKLKQLQGSSPQIMALIKDSKNLGSSNETAKFGTQSVQQNITRGFSSQSFKF